jgi:uncharacterized protein (DUF3084 family)
MFIFLNKLDRKKLEAVLNYVYEQINQSELEAQTLYRRVEFLTKELETLKAQEDKTLEELLKLAEVSDQLKEKDVQSKDDVVE